MKLNKLALTMLLASGLVLTGCGESSESSSSSSTEPTSSDTSSSSSSSSEAAHTAESVIKDIAQAMFGSAVSGTNYFVEDTSFYTVVSMGAFTKTDAAEIEAGLIAAVNTIVSYLPDYLVVSEATAIDQWDDGSKGAFATYTVDSISVELGSDVDTAVMYGQIFVS